VTRLLMAIGANVFLVGAACSGVSFVDHVRIVNDTEYPAHVEVTGKDRHGWLGLAVAEPESTRTVGEVIDHGGVWIFRFEYVGKHQEEVEVSRHELEQNDWTIEVPQSFEQRLRELGVPPPP
jgi:hypothetical protein